MSMLSPEEQQRLSAGESLFASPIPVQSVSSDEFMPAPQTAKQREFELRVKQMGAQMAKRPGVSRRRFFQTEAGMATAFLAMNDALKPLCPADGPVKTAIFGDNMARLYDFKP
jgi:uncharacterized protein